MRTVLFANGDLGESIARYLHERGELQALVLHPTERRRWEGDPDEFDCPVHTWPVPAADLDPAPDCVLSVLFGYLLPPEILDVAQWRALNLHPGLLPWNRGADPNVWPLVDGSPAGTTLHVMAPELDAGPIVAQTEVPHGPADTAETLYRRLIDASFELFTATWPGIEEIEPVEQTGEGSHHRRADLASLDLTEQDLDVIDRLRARTFADFGNEFVRDDKRYRLRVHITECDDGI